MAMSVIGAGPDEDRTRFFRLNLAIIDELTPILRDLLQSEIQPTDIFNTVKQKYLKIFRTDEIALMSTAKTKGYNDFDITLLCKLLRNVCPNIPSPTMKWGLSKMPSQNEITVGDDIERIRLIRNNVQGHIPEAAIPETEFQEYWSIISDICTRMQTLLNKDYVRRLQKAEECTIDSATENQYMDKIKQLAKEEEDIKEILLKILEEKELTSTENLNIEAKSGRKRKLVETLTNTSIYILNEMVKSINEITTEPEIDQLYENIEDFMQGNKEEIENIQFLKLHEKLKRKITSYANSQKPNQMNILAKFYKFNSEITRKYGAIVESSKGSLLLLLTFSSKRGYDLYKEDLKSGKIGKEILELFLYPPYLASFDLEPEDLVVHLNGRLLTKETEDVTDDVMASHSKPSYGLEACVQHPTQHYTMACQQCQLPACKLCMGNPDHKGHVFSKLQDVYQEKMEQLHGKLRLGHTSKNQVLIKKEKFESNLTNVQNRMISKCQHLHELIDQVLQKNTVELKEFQRKENDQIQENLKAIDTFISDLMEHLDEMSKNLPAQTLINLKLGSLSQDFMEFNKTEDPDFYENETTCTLQEVNDLFGNLKLPQMPTRWESGIEIDETVDDEGVTEKPEVLLATSFNVPSIVSHVSAVSAKRAWVSDFYGDLYLIDDTGTEIHRLKTLSNGSGCHTMTKEGDLLYISPEKAIQKVLKDFEIERMKRFIPHAFIACCVYSSHFNSDILVGLWRKDSPGAGAIVRYSESLEESFILKDDEAEDDEALYEYPQYITENINRDVIVSDPMKGVLVVTDAGGKHRFNYQGHSEDSEFEPNGICTDSQAHILVADLITNSVQVLDKDGQFLFFLLTDSDLEVDKPFALSFHLNNLWIGLGSYTRMLVYNVQYANLNHQEMQ